MCVVGATVGLVVGLIQNTDYHGAVIAWIVFGTDLGLSVVAVLLYKYWISKKLRG